MIASSRDLKGIDMIRINQIKLQHDGKSYSSEELRKLLSKKVCKSLRIDEKNIDKLEIIRHSIDARKKPDIFHIYMVDASLKGCDENTVVKKSRDKNVSVIADKGYNFEEQVELRRKALEESISAGVDSALVKSDENSDNCKAANKKVVIIGAGPAGLFCAYELIEKNHQMGLFLNR